MAANPIPNGISELLTMADDAADGLHELQVQLRDIGIKQNTEAAIRTDIDRVVTARRQYRDAQGQQDDRQDDQNTADRAGRRFLVAYRKRISGFLGDNPNAEWEIALDTTGSTRVATTIDKRQDQLQAATNYLTEHPDYADAALGITATIAGNALQVLSTARIALRTAETVTEDKQKELETAVKLLAKRMRGLLGELEQLLPPDDATWHLLELNAPADPDTPEVSEKPTLHPLGDGALEMIFTLPRRAKYAHLWVQQSGVDAEPRRIEGQFQSPAVVRGLPLNVPLLVFISGVNESGSGPRSAAANVTVT